MIQYYEDAIEQKAKEICKVLVVKHREYGAENILLDGLLGIAIRAGDKAARLKTLTHKERDPARLRDTLIDLAGYAIIGLLLLDKQFELPLKPISNTTIYMED